MRTLEEKHRFHLVHSFHCSMPNMFLFWDLSSGLKHVEMMKHPFIRSDTLNLGENNSAWKPPPTPFSFQSNSHFPALFMAVLSLGPASSCSGAAKCQRRCQEHGLPHPSTPVWLDYALPYTPPVTSLPAESAGLHQRSRLEYVKLQRGLSYDHQ